MVVETGFGLVKTTIWCNAVNIALLRTIDTLLTSFTVPVIFLV